MQEDIRTSEPYHSATFLESALVQHEKQWDGLVQARANGGFTNLKGVWVPVEGGPIVECEEGDEGAAIWYSFARCAHEAGVDEHLSTRYYRLAT
jgi:hypothetical protein